MHLQVEHVAGLTVGVGLVEEDESTLVERLVDRLQAANVQVDLVDDLQAMLVLLADVGRVVDVVGQVLGVYGLVAASLEAVVLVPVDEHGHGRLARLQVPEQLVLGRATLEQHRLAQTARLVRYARLVYCRIAVAFGQRLDTSASDSYC